MRLVRIGIFLLLASSASAADRWELQSNFWTSLHNTLLDSAQNGKKMDESLRELEKKPWTDAVIIYRQRYGDRLPWADDELTRINDILTNAPEQLPEGLPEDVARALLYAAPVYRRVSWPADDRANRFWISAAQGLLHDAGEDLAMEHARVYNAPYPSRVRVDVAPFAGPLGAYTTDLYGFVHTTMSSRDPGNQGYAALEMLLHEPSHAIVDVASGQIGPEISARGLEMRLLVPRQLWHAILYYTSGELTRRALRERGVTDYVPYAVKKGMWERSFNGLEKPLETFWQSYIDGRMTRQDAIVSIVRATGTIPPPRVADH